MLLDRCKFEDALIRLMKGPRLRLEENPSVTGVSLSRKIEARGLASRYVIKVYVKTSTDADLRKMTESLPKEFAFNLNDKRERKIVLPTEVESAGEFGSAFG